MRDKLIEVENNLAGINKTVQGNRVLLNNVINELQYIRGRIDRVPNRQYAIGAVTGLIMIGIVIARCI